MDWAIFPLGLAVGFLGNLTGVGGGFLLMPLLLMIFPHQRPSELAFLTMGAVFANSLTGIVPSALKRRIRWRWAFLFSLVSLPGVLLGALVQTWVNRPSFVLIFGAFLTLLGIFFFLNAGGRLLPPVKDPRAFHHRLALALALPLGFLSGFMGVGGGFLFVPLFLLVLRLNPSQAVSTVQPVLCSASAVFLTFALVQGRAVFPWSLAALLLGGVVLGALGGSLLLGKMTRSLLLRVLAVLLLVLGVKMLWGGV